VRRARSASYQTALKEERSALGGKLRIGVVLTDALDSGARAEHNGSSRVEFPRFYIQDALHRIGGASTGLLDQQRDWVRFVDQAQPTAMVAAPLIAGIKEHAPAQQNAIRICNQRRGPAHVVILGQRPVGAAYAIVHVGADRIVPVAIVCGVHRVFCRIAWNREMRNRQPEFWRILWCWARRLSGRQSCDLEQSGAICSM